MENTQHTQLATLSSADIWDLSAKFAKSGLMGPSTTAEQAFGLMMLCQCEGLNPISALKRYHIIEGRPSMRADAMMAEFLASGGSIIWHVRTDEMCAATFLSNASGQADEEKTQRAAKRFSALWSLDSEPDPAKRGKLMKDLGEIARPGEETILRTYADCEAKGLTQGRDGTKTNWAKSPRQMLTARVGTEGIRLIAPGLIAGIYAPEEISDFSEKKNAGVAAEKKTPDEKRAEATEIKMKALNESNPEKKREMLGQAADLAIEADEIPMEHEGDKVVHAEIVREELKFSDEKIVEPAKAAAKAPEKPAQGYDTPFRDYVITECKVAALCGRALSAMSAKELQILNKTRATPFLKSGNEALKLEATKIREAFDASESALPRRRNDALCDGGPQSVESK